MPWVCPLSSSTPHFASHHTSRSAVQSANRLIMSTTTGSSSER